MKVDVETQTEGKESDLSTQEEHVQDVIPLTQRQSKLVKRQYVFDSMKTNLPARTNLKRNKLDTNNTVSLFSEVRTEPKFNDPKALNQPNTNLFKRKTGVLYKGTFGSRMFLGKRARLTSPNGQISEGLLSRLSTRSTKSKQVEEPQMKKEIIEEPRKRKESM